MEIRTYLIFGLFVCCAQQNLTLNLHIQGYKCIIYNVAFAPELNLSHCILLKTCYLYSASLPEQGELRYRVHGPFQLVWTTSSDTRCISAKINPNPESKFCEKDYLYVLGISNNIRDNELLSRDNLKISFKNLCYAHKNNFYKNCMHVNS